MREVGAFHAVSAEGWLVNPATGVDLQREWVPALDALGETCRRAAGDAFHSFYVRGSVASGRAVPGSSDLDTVLVVADDGGERRPAWAREAGDALVVEDPDLVDVEVVVLGKGALLTAAADPDPLRGEPVMAQWCFLLGVGARCLEGPDLLPQLGKFYPGVTSAFVLRALPRTMPEFERRRQAAGDDPLACRRLAPWVCKKVLRAGAELAMLSDGRFTRDLVPCSRQLAARLPELATVARRLLAWAIDPPEVLGEVAAVVAATWPVLVDEARAAGVGLEAGPGREQQGRPSRDDPDCSGA